MSARLVRASELRSNMPWHLLLTIASALVVSLVLSQSGLAALLSSTVLNSFATPSPWIVLILVLLLTVAMTEIMTNNAAAALVFPIAFSFSQSLEVSHMPFVMAVLFGASASFMTPFGYQTNLMVMSPGAYRSRDYFRLGAPVSVVYLVACAFLLPVFYPF
jgi:di/tricarboxylate transporter